MGTFSESRKNHLHNQETVVSGTFVFGSSYATGGESLDVGLSEVRNAEINGGNGVQFVYDATNKKLKALTVKPSAVCLNKAGLAIGATTPKKGVTITNTIDLLFGSTQVKKTTQEVAFTATTHDIAADGSLVQEAVFRYSVASNGNITVTGAKLSCP